MTGLEGNIEVAEARKEGMDFGECLPVSLNPYQRKRSCKQIEERGPTFKWWENKEENSTYDWRIGKHWNHPSTQIVILRETKDLCPKHLSPLGEMLGLQLSKTRGKGKKQRQKD
ncbi:MAG: hypothetical protein KC588_14650 [Nitrospira sp.]|nr:hypothetical protein [Nitrospira sp.]